MGKLKLLLPLFIILGVCMWPDPAYAHAFGIQYTLPIPLWMYLYGGAAAVIVSFLIVGFFVNQKKSYRSLLHKLPSAFGIFISPTMLRFTKIFSFLLFLLTIISGLFGTNESIYNFNMTFFWIIFLLGLTYLTALIGNIWPVINPLSILIGLFERVKINMDGIYKYPTQWGYLPSLVFYYFLIWTELVSRVNPQALSVRIIIYVFFSLLCAFLFGKKTFFKYFDFFGLFFSLIGRVSPVKPVKGRLYLTLPFTSLTDEKADHFSIVPFIVFMLASTAFDGFHSTSVWFNWEISHLEQLEVIGGGVGFILVQSLALLFFLGLFLSLYLILVSLMKILTKVRTPVLELAKNFSFSLVPIALVYNIAHYYTLLTIQGQSIIALISDPFGLGWNLFGTSAFTPNIRLLSAKFIWNSEVFLILFGHIVAVYLAHLVALKSFPSHKRALISQFPMLGLMVCYTVFGLWILAQPLTGG